MSRSILYVFRAIWWMVILNLLSVPIAAADGTCEDILANAPYDVTQYQDTSYVFMDRESTQAEKDHLDHSGTFGITIDDIPFDFHDIGNADRQITQNQSFQFSSENRLSVLIYSGAKNIIDAWLQCMTSLGGIRLRFESDDASGLFTNHLLLHIQYFPSVQNGIIIDQPNMHLNSPGKIPEAKSVTDDAHCLDPATKYVAGKTECIVKIETNSPWDSFSVALDFVDDNGNKQTKAGFVPVRAKLHATSQPWPKNTPEIVLYAYANYSAAEPNAHNIKRETPDIDGYFIQDSVQSSVSGNTYNCYKAASVDPGGGGVVLEIDVTQADKQGEQCFGHFRGTQVQMYWNPPQPPPSKINEVLGAIGPVEPWSSNTAWVRYDTLSARDQNLVGRFANTFEDACKSKTYFTYFQRNGWQTQLEARTVRMEAS